MRTHARVVVIGGGVMGVSLLYHLARRGWSDVVLVERQELTAGSTWHAAGLCTHFSHSPTIMEMRAATVRLYREVLPRETGLATGFHPCGALRVTGSAERISEFRQVRDIGRFVGHEFRVLTPDELAAVYPLCRLDGLLGAIHEPCDGHVDPTMGTNAMAAAARSRGAEIVRHNPVTAITRTRGGEWSISTREGEIRAEHVVNAAGTWCREIGTMMGVDLPVVAMLHQYVVTDRVAELAERNAAGEPELPIIRDPEQSWYLRQEGDAYIVGPYEKEGRTWAVDGVPPEFGMELLPPDLDRIEHIVAMAMERVPALAEAGLKRIVNGPITFTPDGNPLIGPAFGLRNAWLLTGTSMGVMEGGGAGSLLADWIVDGAPPLDPIAVDSRRFGDFADRDYRIDKATECFGLQFGVHYPYEERPAGRPRRVTPIYERQREAGAVFGCVYGWERPNWYATGEGPREVAPTFARPGWFDAVGDECRAVADSVGIADLSAFSKFEVSGVQAPAFMEVLGANRPPARVGRIGLMHALTVHGGVDSEFSVTRIAEDRYYLISAAAAERHDEMLLRARAEGFAAVEVANRTREVGILALAGPNARELLASVTDADLGDDAMPWLSCAEIVAGGVGARALRVSYAGELGWELHVPLQHLDTLYDALTAAGRRFELRPFGAYALNSMRLEKGYRAWGSDLTTERTPLEAGLAALVRTDERMFVGRDALLGRAGAADAWRMALFEVDSGDAVDPFYAHPVWRGEEVVGLVTSGAFGHRTGKALCLAYLRPHASTEAFEIALLGRRCPARELTRVPYDPDGTRMRGHGPGADRGGGVP